MADYTPLRTPDEPQTAHAPLEAELRLARESLARAAVANIHDHHAMIDVAVNLDHRMRSLIAALQVERGGA